MADNVVPTPGQPERKATERHEAALPETHPVLHQSAGA
jgi:hypothetical protein